jgi:hypothetical protein
MSKCPINHLRKELPALTPRLASLPVDERGYPVPFFVAWIDGKPEFRMADGDKRVRCFRDKLCWVCGQRLGVHSAFTIGPMCMVNRVTSEPPTHLDCAEWSVKGCPFLSKPKMERREDELTRANKGKVDGIMIERNPGVSCLWVTREWRLFKVPNGVLVKLGKPESLSFWREGRPATRDEIVDSIESGLPKLLEVCDSPQEIEELNKATSRAMELLPA